MKCLILAGGFATRLYPLTKNRAKALLEFRGKPIISHIVARIPQGMEILVSTNKKFEADFVAWQKTLDTPVELCLEEAVTDEQKKGAVSAIDHWIKSKNITEDLLVIAADNYFDLDLADMITNFNGKNTLIAVFDVGDKEKACEIGKSCQIGLVVLTGNQVARFDEKPELPTSSIIATGIYILPRRIFPLLEQYCHERKRDNMGNLITYLLEQKEKVMAYTFSGTWIDLGDEIKKGNIKV